MVEAKGFQVVFDNPIATYYSGEVVSGQIVAKVRNGKNFEGIEVKCLGQGDVKWAESHGTAGQAYHAHEKYFENKQYVVGSANSMMRLPAGEHFFPFSLTLPNNLPSSFEGPGCIVRYTVKATLYRPWAFDYEAKAAFTVIQPLDLNAEEGVKEPVHMIEEKFMCCLCCKSGPLTMVATIPATGYVPGQDIPVTIQIENATEQTIVDVDCNLNQISTVHDLKGNADTKKSKVAMDNTEELVGPHRSGCWTVKLKVPSLPPSYLKYCNIIDVEYELTIKGMIFGPYENMAVRIPIVLGTVPLRSYFPVMSRASASVPPPDEPSPQPSTTDIPSPLPQPSTSDIPPPLPPPPSRPVVPRSLPPASNADLPPSFSELFGEDEEDFQPSAGPCPPVYLPNGIAGPSASTAQSALVGPHLMYPEMPPPSYEECMFGKIDIRDSEDNDDIQGEMGFAPRYPMYQFND